MAVPSLEQVLSVTLSTIKNCEHFKQQYNKYDFLWKQDLHQTLQVCRLHRRRYTLAWKLHADSLFVF